jgi:hypothetical protein
MPDADGNISYIAEGVLGIAMVHREFIERATEVFIRYQESEGFDISFQSKLQDTLLNAKK